jgi:hypothetical protein
MKCPMSKDCSCNARGARPHPIGTCFFGSISHRLSCLKLPLLACPGTTCKGDDDDDDGDDDDIDNDDDDDDEEKI